MTTYVSLTSRGAAMSAERMSADAVSAEAMSFARAAMAVPALAAAAAIPAAYAAAIAFDAKAVVRPWQAKQHATTRTNGQGLTAWSPPL